MATAKESAIAKGTYGKNASVTEAAARHKSQKAAAIASGGSRTTLNAAGDMNNSPIVGYKGIPEDVADGTFVGTEEMRNPIAPTATANPLATPVPYQSKTFTQTDPNDPTLSNDRGEKVDKATYLAQGGKPDFSNVQKGFQNALASGQQAPQTGGEARGLVDSLMPQTGPNTSVVEQQLAQDPDYAALLQTKKEYDDVVNQRTSLTQEYSQMVKKMGINALNTELMNMKNVIDGTEDDIRNEVTKAGGFATDSQVLALTLGRNKQLVKNYNNLLETKQMAMEQVNTMMNLSVQDRQLASQAIMQKMQINGQILEYKDKMKQNAIAGFERIVSRMGYDGLAQMTNGDPYYTSMIEKTMGLGNGGLQQLAQKDIEARQAAQAQVDFDNRIKQQQVNISAGNLAVSRQNAVLAGQRLEYDIMKDMTEDAKAEQLAMQSKQNLVTDLSTKLATIKELASHKGIQSAVGTNSLWRWAGDPLAKTTGVKQDFIGRVQSLTSKETLDALKQLKQQSGGGLGSPSDRDIALLENSASAINQWAVKDGSGRVTHYNINEAAFRTELSRLYASTERIMQQSAGLTSSDINNMNQIIGPGL